MALRSDAIANRAKIMIAAREVFASDGVDAPLELIAKRAGVGRATLYRNFSDRYAILVGLLDDAASALESAARDCDGDDALFQILDVAVRELESHSLISDYWRAAAPDATELRDVRKRLEALFARPLSDARRAGLCRSDLEPRDMPLILNMLGAALRMHSSGVSGDFAHRARMLLIEGLRPR